MNVAWVALVKMCFLIQTCLLQPSYTDILEVNDEKESTVIDVDCQAVAEDYEDFVLEEDHNWDLFETPIEVPHDAAVDMREFENQNCFYKKELDMKENTIEEENSISKYTKDTPEILEISLTFC